MNVNGLLSAGLGVALLMSSLGCSSKHGPEQVTSSAPPTTSAPPPRVCASGESEDAGCIPERDAQAAGQGPIPSPSPSAPLAPSGRCPELPSTERVLGFDWIREFNVDESLVGKLKGLSGTAAETKAFAQEVDAELKVGCIGIASTLGAKGPFGSADVTCQAAVDALREARSKLGRGARIAVQVHPPVCGMPVPSECVAACAGEAAKASCDSASATVGGCSDNCNGTCEFASAGRCDGNCQGRCESGFSGTCTGTCKGQCNGADMKEGGTCAGKCEGSCEGTTRGSCKGLCRGGCQGTSVACPGTCVGKCSSSLRDPRCINVPKVEGGDPLCTSFCETRSIRRATCTPGVVNVTVSGAADTAAGRRYEQAIERHLPRILKAERHLRGRIERVTKNQSLVSEGINAVTRSSPPSLAALSPCLLSAQTTMTEGVSLLNAAFRSASLVTTVAQSK